MKRYLDINAGVSGSGAALQGLDQAFLNGGDVLPGNIAALDLVDKLEALAWRQRLQGEYNMRILPVPAALLAKTLLMLDAFADGLAIGHLGHAAVHRDIELAAQTVQDDLQMQLAHA